MKKGLFTKILAMAMSTVLAFGLPSAVPQQTEAGQSAPEGYIRIEDASKPDEDYAYTEKYLYNYWSQTDVVSSYSGMTYNLATNTMTIANCKNSEISVFIDGMGTDFKILLSGENALGSIGSMRTGISIEGQGSLTVNADRKEHAAARLSGTTPPPFEVDDSYYVNSTLHIGGEATVTFYSGNQNNGGVNLEILSSTKSQIGDVLTYDGNISHVLDFQPNVNKGTTEYQYYHNDIFAYHTVPADLLYVDSEGNTYLEDVAEGYSDYFAVLEQHDDKWYASNSSSQVYNLEQYTDNLPQGLSNGEGTLGVYEKIRYEDKDENNQFVFLNGYTKNNKLYVIMPKKALTWENDTTNAASQAYCLAEIEPVEGFELGYNYEAPWLMEASSVTDVPNVADYKQAESYMLANGYTKKGYTTPDTYEFIVMNDVLTFSPKQAQQNPTGDGKTPDQTDTGKTSDQAPAKGTSETDQKTGATYTVTESAGGKTEVEYKASAKATDTKVNIPSKVNVNGVEATVTSIADNAFANNKKVTSVTLPATIEEIGDGAFKNCTKLKTVTIPKKVGTLGKNAFAGCSSLTKVNVKSTSIKKIDQGAFKNCKKLTEITLTKNVTSIGKEAFSGDKKLKKITITSTKLKSIGKNAFKNVPKSTVIKVPKKQKKAYTAMLKKAGFKGTVK